MGTWFYVLDGHRLEVRLLSMRRVDVTLDGGDAASGRWRWGRAAVEFTAADGASWKVVVRQWLHTTTVAVWKDGRQLVGWHA